MESIIQFDKERLINELRNLHGKLANVYIDIFQLKYSQNNEFNRFIDREYSENNISKGEMNDWNTKFSHRAAYTLINKILFIRICEDMGFMLGDEDKYSDGTPKHLNAGTKLTNIGYQKWTELITNYTLGELLQLAFEDMGKSYPNIILYKEDKYEKLNPDKEDFEHKFFLKDYKNSVLKRFEDIIEETIQTLDVSRYDFKEAVKSNVLGDVYEKFMDRETRKALGQFYTPDFVIDYILNNTVEEADVVENPFVRVLDPACGSGHFLIKAYDILKRKFEVNLNILKEKYSDAIYQIRRNGITQNVTGCEYWKRENLHYHILKHCIYGADIDDFAVQLTTINLLLKDFENVSDELNIIQCDSLKKWEEDYDWQDLKRQLLGENIEHNYVYKDLFGNEQIEYVKFDMKEVAQQVFKGDFRDDFELKQIGVEGKEIKHINRNEAVDLLKICEFWAQKYDYVVGNPPYVRQEKILNKGYLEKNYEVYNSIADLLTYFVERSLKEIKEYGKFGLIVSDKFTRANYGKKLRKFILESHSILKYKDRFEENKIVFDDATVDTCILIIGNNKSNDKHYLIYNDTEELLQHDFDEGGWSFSQKSVIKIKNKMESIGIKIKDCSGLVINRGIITGLNQAFIINSKKKEELCRENPNCSDIIKPLLRGRNIDKYSCKWDQLWLIFIPWHFPLKVTEVDSASDIAEKLFEEKYKPIYNHLLKYKEKLMNRNSAETGIRYEWYALQRFASTYYGDFEKNKIIYPEIAIENRFYYDEDKFFINNKAFIMASENVNLKYLSGLLNSSTLFFYYRLVAPKLLGETREYRKVFIDETPIILNSIYEERIIKNVEVLLESNNKLEDLTVNGFYNYENNRINKVIKKERAKLEINQIVYCMYQLSPDEIIYIESDTCKYISKEKNDYLNDIKNGKPIIADIFNYEYIKQLKTILNPDVFIEEHIRSNKSLETIAEEHKCEFVTVALLREEYANLYGGNEPWKFYNLTELYKAIFEYLKDIALEVMENQNRYICFEEIMNLVKDKCSNFDELVNVLRNKDASIDSTKVVKEALNSYSETWNSYLKNRKADKETEDIIKYDNTTYGLASWPDEIHKEYFLSIINEYTGNNPNKKKAEEVPKIIKELDIEDKEAYIDVINSKIKKAFK